MRKTGNIQFYIIFIVVSLSVSCVSHGFAGPVNLEGLKQVESSHSVTHNNDVINRPVLVYKNQEARDPFEPYLLEEDELEASKKEALRINEQKVERKPPDLKIQGLVWGGNFPQAIINNKVIKTGEIIEGANIKSINKEGVTFIFEGKEYKSSVSEFTVRGGVRK